MRVAIAILSSASAIALTVRFESEKTLFEIFLFFFFKSSREFKTGAWFVFARVVFSVMPAASKSGVRTRKRRSSPGGVSGSGGGGGGAGTGTGTGAGNWNSGAADVIMDEDEDSDVMDECAAAMVLMRLSCSPHSPRWEGKQSVT